MSMLNFQAYLQERKRKLGSSEENEDSAMEAHSPVEIEAKKAPLKGKGDQFCGVVVEEGDDEEMLEQAERAREEEEGAKKESEARRPLSFFEFFTF
mmetsp:Transcript_5006/g.8538  ORF Transcript_5006/g.8538 Transcript_5006/m.8538 type:complete len:96 (+) Transcript_5006:531-818(+)